MFNAHTIAHASAPAAALCAALNADKSKKPKLI
jgi:hypothetical protein